MRHFASLLLLVNKELKEGVIFTLTETSTPAVGLRTVEDFRASEQLADSHFANYHCYSLNGETEEIIQGDCKLVF